MKRLTLTCAVLLATLPLLGQPALAAEKTATQAVTSNAVNQAGKIGRAHV